MPFLVRVTEGDNPREIAENVDDVTAHSMAQSISAATGETVELVPYEYDHAASEWQLAEHATTTVAVTVDEPATEQHDVDLDALDDEALDLLAAEHEVADWSVDADIEEKRALLSGLLGIARAGKPDFDGMNGTALDSYAADHNIAAYKKSGKVDDRRAAVVAWFVATAGGTPVDELAGEQLDTYAAYLGIEEWDATADDDAKRASIAEFLSA